MATPITYVGKRESYVDGLYGTGAWERGQTKPVNDDVASKMLRHADQYQRGEQAPAGPQDKKPEGDETKDPEVGAKDKKPEGDDEAAMQEARDSVAHMEKDALIEYAQTHFRIPIDKRLGVENIRQKVVQLIDQYGLT